MGAAEWVHRSRELRRELAVVESGVASEDEQREAYLAGLRRELSGWLQVLEHAHELGMKRETLHGSGPNGAQLMSEKTGLEMAEEAQATIEAIEAEIERCAG